MITHYTRFLLRKLFSCLVCAQTSAVARVKHITVCENSCLGYQRNVCILIFFYILEKCPFLATARGKKGSTILSPPSLWKVFTENYSVTAILWKFVQLQKNSVKCHRKMKKIRQNGRFYRVVCESHRIVCDFRFYRVFCESHRMKVQRLFFSVPVTEYSVCFKEILYAANNILCAVPEDSDRYHVRQALLARGIFSTIYLVLFIFDIKNVVVGRNDCVIRWLLPEDPSARKA